MRSILFTQRVEVIESYQERRDCADQRIAQLIGCCGYLPIPVPNHEKYAVDLVNKIRPSGIVLTGGNSLVKYGGNAPERDRTDGILIATALERRIPLYGFCRGMQSILDYFGNTLVEVKNHVAVRHKVRGIYGDWEVNSYHNQGCIELGSEELKVVCRSEDGVIEMVQHVSRPLMGTMWHPEREADFLETDIFRIQRLMEERQEDRI